MLTSRSSFETPNASRYLQQLCKHFGHKVDAEYTETEGKVSFPVGQLDLAASDDRLDFIAQSDDAQGLEKTKAVVEDHIIRFAFREKLTGLSWSD